MLESYSAGARLPKRRRGDSRPRLTSALEALWQAIIATAALTGMRQGEVIALRWGDVDLAKRQITVRRSYSEGRLSEQPKTAAGAHTIDIGKDLAAILKRWKLKCPRSPIGLCFPSPKGRHLDAGQLTRAAFKPALKAAGLRPVRFHDLRHGFASALLLSGVDLVRVSKVLGHASPVVTMSIYAHVLRGLGQHLGDQVDTLFGASGSKTVADGSERAESGAAKTAQVIDLK